MHTVTSAHGLVFLTSIVQFATVDAICKAGTYGQLTENLILSGTTKCQPGIVGTYAKTTRIHDGVSTYSQVGPGATRHIFRIQIGPTRHMWLLGWYMGEDKSINFRNHASSTSVPVHSWEEMCIDGFYLNTISFVLNSLFDCKDCGMHSNSAEGSTMSTNCLCNAGFSGPNGQTCTQCTEGKYKTGTGSAECNDCGPGKYMSQNGTAYCKNCAAGKYTSFSNSTFCEDCATGKYNPDTGKANCEDCGAGKYNTVPGSVDCQECAIGKFRSYLKDVNCQDCVVGKYNVDTANANCQTCASGKYNSVPGSNSCQDCPVNSVPTASSAFCLCNAGFSGANDGNCTACADGQYKSDIGNANCQYCPVNSNSAARSTTSTACLCNIGFSGLNGEVCVACAKGKFRITSFPGNCQTCEVGKYKADVGMGKCQDCPPGSNSTADSASCLCNAGFSGADDGSCIVCADGKYKSDIGNDNCQYCPVNSNSAAQSTTSTACSCNIGFSGLNGEACVACAEGKYKITSGSASCESCKAGSSSMQGSNTTTACVCYAGFSRFISDDDSCTRDLTLPDNKYSAEFHFGIHVSILNISEEIANEIQTQTSVFLNISRSRITRIQFSNSIASSRRLLNSELSFSIFSQSEYDITHIISLATFERIATILRVASSESINVTSTRVTISVQRDKVLPSQPTPASSNISTILIVLAVLFVCVFASICFICQICNLDTNYRNMHPRQVHHLHRHENVAYFMH